MQTRPATAIEADQDRHKRRLALVAAERDGLYSDRQLEKFWAELDDFKGYPRPLEARGR